MSDLRERWMILVADYRLAQKAADETLTAIKSSSNRDPDSW